MQTKICEVCKRKFNARHKWQKFCSYKCSNKNKETCKDVECPTCHKIFHQRQSAQKYCSRRCIPHIGHKKLQNILCPICNQEFHPIRARQQCCSNECRIELTKKRLRERRVAYSDKEKSVRIQKWTSLTPKMKSKTNEKYWALLEAAWYKIDCYDFLLGGMYYDIKIWNTLIEINPSATHNTIRMPKFANWCSPHSDDYHYKKYKIATRNWYKYINVWDRTTEQELFNMMKRDFVYEWAPQLHRYNIKTKEHLLDGWFDRDEMLENWYVPIYDSWTILFNKELQCS